MSWNIFRNSKKEIAVRELNKVVNTDVSNINSVQVENMIRQIDKTYRDIDKNIDEITGPDYRIKTITDWVNAMRSASQPWRKDYMPSWVQLFDIFENVIQDTHVNACIGTLSDGLLSKEFYIVDEKGEKLDEVTEIFKSQWFDDFLNSVLNARLFGFNLIQIDSFDKTDNSIKTREISRYNVRPDLGGVVKQEYDNTIMADWNKEPFKTWTIFIFDNVLGQLNPIVRWYIYKIEIARLWAVFNQLYGVPPVIGKTSLKDTTRKANMISALKSFVKARFMVVGDDDEITQFQNSTSASGQQFFENFIRLCDEQISKSMLGSTMVLDNGSSRSQSEVHEENTAKFVRSIARFAKHIVDKELIPRLNKIGLAVPLGCKLIWDNSEKITMVDRANIVNTLNLDYKISADVASEFVGIEMEDKEEEPQLNIPAQEALANYKIKFKK